MKMKRCPAIIYYLKCLSQNRQNEQCTSRYGQLHTPQDIYHPFITNIDIWLFDNTNKETNVELGDEMRNIRRYFLEFIISHFSRILRINRKFKYKPSGGIYGISRGTFFQGIE